MTEMISHRQLMKNGCRIFLLSSPVMAERMKNHYEDASVILAEDSLQAMQPHGEKLSGRSGYDPHRRDRQRGKDIDEEMLQQIFSSSYRTICNRENFNNHIGVPLTAF